MYQCFMKCCMILLLFLFLCVEDDCCKRRMRNHRKPSMTYRSWSLVVCSQKNSIVPKGNSLLFTRFNSRKLSAKKIQCYTNNAQNNSTAPFHCTVTNHPILPCSEKDIAKIK